MASTKSEMDELAGNASSSDFTSGSTCCDDHNGGSKDAHRMPTIFDIVKSGYVYMFRPVWEKEEGVPGIC